MCSCFYIIYTTKVIEHKRESCLQLTLKCLKKQYGEEMNYKAG